MTEAGTGGGDVWPSPPAALGSPLGEVHVWLAPLGCAPARLAAFRRTLAPDEAERADRFRFEKDRAHFVAARGMLRSLLSRYLGRRPESLGFDYTRYGKPSLRGADALSFNLSHSHELALIAVSDGRALGVDLEHVRPDFAHMDVARRFFSPREVEALESLPGDARTAAFFDCWTRKEAYIKARGEGLSCPLDCFDVSLRPGERAALLATRDDPSEAARWSMHELPVAAGYKAALVAERHDYRLRRWHWADTTPII